MKQGIWMVVALVLIAVGIRAADEISMMQQFGVTKGYLSVSKGVDSLATMYGDAYDQKVTRFDTNELNTITVSPTITTAGVAFVRNLSTNCNAVVVASFELYPGETLMGRLLTTNIVVYAKTNGVPGLTTVPAEAVNVESIILAQ